MTVTLVTGGASGFGAEVSRLASEQGHQVVIADIDSTKGEAVAKELGATFVKVDVSSPGGNEEMVHTAVSTYGQLDNAILNAGIVSGVRGVDDFTLERYRTVLGVNFESVVFGVQACVPAMRKNHGGSIVATASLAGLLPMANDPLYSATKHAVVAYMRAMSTILATDNIRSNAVCPGYSDTPLLTEAADTFREADFPLLTPTEVAQVMLDVVLGDTTGEAWFVQPGRSSAPFRFSSVPGARHPDGTPVGLPPDI